MQTQAASAHESVFVCAFPGYSTYKDLYIARHEPLVDLVATAVRQVIDLTNSTHTQTMYVAFRLQACLRVEQNNWLQ